VAVGIVFDNSEDFIFWRKAASQSTKVIAESRQGYFAPCTGVAINLHLGNRRDGGGKVRVKKGGYGREQRQVEDAEELKADRVLGVMRRGRLEDEGRKDGQFLEYLPNRLESQLVYIAIGVRGDGSWGELWWDGRVCRGRRRWQRHRLDVHRKKFPDE
jgi:hypothetical protein